MKLSNSFRLLEK